MPALRGAGNIQKFDPKTSALQIKTNNWRGIRNRVALSFLDSGVYPAGKLYLHFNKPMQYELHSCTTRTTKKILRNVPVGKKKVWTIYRKSNLFKIECNGVGVAEFKLSSCSHGEKWINDRDIAQVMFEETDTASDSYRIKGKSR